MYLLNNIDFSAMDDFQARLRKAVWINFLCALPFLLYVLVSLLVMQGFSVGADGVVSMVANKYLHNLLAMPLVLGLLLVGLVLVIVAVLLTAFKGSTKGIWLAGLGTVLVGLAVFFTAGFNNTPFYPSKADLQSSLTIVNASSSRYTLTAMTYVALGIPLVLAYIAYVWSKMDSRKLAAHEVVDEEAY
jgi:cytochrome d ubiquinol oxidase subunit II